MLEFVLLRRRYVHHSHYRVVGTEVVVRMVPPLDSFISFCWLTSFSRQLHRQSITCNMQNSMQSGAEPPLDQQLLEKRLACDDLLQGGQISTPNFMHHDTLKTGKAHTDQTRWWFGMALPRNFHGYRWATLVHDGLVFFKEVNIESLQKVASSMSAISQCVSSPHTRQHFVSIQSITPICM